MSKLKEEYKEVNKDNYQNYFLKAAKTGNLQLLKYIIEEYTQNRDMRNKAVHIAIKSQHPKVLKHLLDIGRFDLTDSGDKDIKNSKDLFELSKTGSLEIWQLLTQANSYTSHGKIDDKTIKNIAISDDATYKIRNYYAYKLLDKNTLEKKDHLSGEIKLRTLFNFHSCQETSIVEKGSSISIAVNDFNSFSKRDFFDEMYDIYKDLGGKRKHPFKIDKAPL